MFQPGIKTIVLAIALEFLITIGGLVLMGSSPASAQAWEKVAPHAPTSAPVHGEEIWRLHDLVLYKIQDGFCTLYVVREYPAMATVAGPGCQR